MYNRYIPQSDGSYRRSTVPDPYGQHSARPQRPSPPPPEPPPPTPKPPKACPKPCTAQKSQPRHTPPPTQGIGSFLKQLLPSDFDTGDLLVVLLLLLISSDGGEDRSTALLTLALYLFL